METYINFQYKAEGKRPDDITITDVPTQLIGTYCVPSVGDIVNLQIASNIKEFKDKTPGSFCRFQVIGRQFQYCTKDGMGKSEIDRCDIYIIVSDVNNDVPGYDIKV
jgi:hypothetical protein